MFQLSEDRAGLYREGETLNAKGDRIAAFAIARTLVLGLEEGSAEERLGLGPRPFWQLEVGSPAACKPRYSVT